MGVCGVVYVNGGSTTGRDRSHWIGGQEKRSRRARRREETLEGASDDGTTDADARDADAGGMPAVDVEETLRARWCEDGGGPEAEEAMRRAAKANARARRCDEGESARARERARRMDDRIGWRHSECVWGGGDRMISTD